MRTENTECYGHIDRRDQIRHRSVPADGDLLEVLQKKPPTP